MKASVIISAYNNLNDLYLLLPSLEHQSLDPHEMEVIIRDDGSRDDTCAWIKEHYPWVRLICGRNVGFSRSNNSAVRRASGDVLVFVNADTVLDQHFIAAGLRVLEQQPLAGGVNGNMVMPWVMDVRRFLDGDRPSDGQGFFLNRYGFADYRKVAMKRCRTAFLSGGGCFVRRAALGDEDPFAEDLWGGTAYCEDLDLSLRLLAKGWRLYFEPAAILYHNQRPIEQVRFSQFAKFVRVSVNRVTVYASNLSLAGFLYYMPGLFYGVLQKVNHLSMPEKLKKKALLAAVGILPFLIMFLPYWIYQNIRSGFARPQIPDLSFLKGDA